MDSPLVLVLLGWIEPGYKGFVPMGQFRIFKWAHREQIGGSGILASALLKLYLGGMAWD